MTKHLGNIIVTQDNALDFPAVTEFYGHLTIEAPLVAPDLTLIRGWLTILPGGSLTAPVLGRVEGWVMLGSDSWVKLDSDSALDAPNLTEITEDLIINPGVAFPTAALQTVGALVIQRITYFHTLVRSVRRGVSLSMSAILHAPNLTSIGGSITLKAASRFEAPELAHIGGFYDADPTATLIAPMFTGA